MKKIKAFWHRLRLCYYILFKMEYYDIEDEQNTIERFMKDDNPH
ncbi:unnamed protein product [marine sediment metagenome]|uniref:Uncharacterized protein n=1 Tax=marine sediment metagenome TaxID=412755 RepID=X1CVZ4_9ZZZZ